MRTVTATEASRSFAALLDAAENGESVLITRGGRRIASLGSATSSNGAKFLTLLDESGIDDGYAADVEKARDAV